MKTNPPGEILVLLFTAEPEFMRLDAALLEAGLSTMRVATVEVARHVLATRRGACIAVLNTTRAAPHYVDSVYRLLHQSAPVPTLLLFPREGSSTLHIETISALDDYAYTDDSVDELVRRVCILSRRVELMAPAGAAQTPAAPTRFQPGRSIVVYGPKGGVGRTTIAVNLALALTRLYRKQVALIDADLWFGDVSVLLDVRSPQSMSTLLASASELDAESLRSALITHSSGLRVLQAPTGLLSVDKIPDYMPARLASLCCTMFDHVVVDTHSALQEDVLQLLEGASQVLLVMTPEVSALRSAIRVLELAPTLGWADKLLLVLNRADSGVPLREVEATLGRPVDIPLVTASRLFVTAGNYGEPLLMSDPNGREHITRGLGRLAARVVGEPEPTWGRGRAWRRAFGRLRPSPAPEPGREDQRDRSWAGSSPNHSGAGVDDLPETPGWDGANRERIPTPQGSSVAPTTAASARSPTNLELAMGDP